MYPYAIVQDGKYRYELTELTCEKNARAQRAGYPLDEKGTARWLDQHIAKHPGTRSFTRYYDSTYDGAGCYEITPAGLQTYRQGSAARLVQARIIPCRQELLENGGSCATPRSGRLQAPVAAPAADEGFVVRGDGVVLQPAPVEDQFSPKPSRDAGVRMIQFLLTQPYGRDARPIDFDGVSATLWQISCKEAAGFQMSSMSGADYPFFNWLSNQSGKLMTIQRVDGAHQQACYRDTPTGIAILGYRQAEAYVLHWR
jgi:hypothetical protein